MSFLGSRYKLFQFTSWILLISLVTGPFSTLGNNAMASSSEESIASGFQLQLKSSVDPKLNGTFRVRSTGKVSLPYNVLLDAAGKTLKNFSAEVTKAYAGYFQGKPDIQVSIRQRRYYAEIRGIVKNPGLYLLQESSPLDEIVSLAGGISAGTGEQTVLEGFMRIDQGGKISWIDLSKYFKDGAQVTLPKWKGGERIFFQRERPDSGEGKNLTASTNQEIQVLGEVRNPGPLSYRSDADVYHYLSQTGGPTSAADLDRVEVIRVDPETGERDSIDITPLSDIRKVEKSDILIVHPQRQSGFDRTLQHTAMIASILTAALLVYTTLRTPR